MARAMCMRHMGKEKKGMKYVHTSFPIVIDSISDCYMLYYLNNYKYTY